MTQTTAIFKDSQAAAKKFIKFCRARAAIEILWWGSRERE